MLHSRAASNWVDRGAPPDEKLRQVLAHYLGCPEVLEASAATPEAAWLATAVTDVYGMVVADAAEVQVAGYLRTLARERGRTPDEIRGARVVAIALWHVVKAAEVRDRAERVLRAAGVAPPGTRAPLAEWLAARLLTPGELAAYRAERARRAGEESAE